jgi:5'-deoxynucleotidase YfbR-like HD superfamily hydrolase
MTTRSQCETPRYTRRATSSRIRLLVFGWCRTEYEAGQTKEAKLCKDFDKIEMILQALEYENSQGKELQEFFDSTAGKWRTALGCAA